MTEEGRKKLAGLAAKVRETTASTGVPTMEERGLALVEELVAMLSGPEGMPGLRLHRESPAKFRLERPPRNADIWVEWQRPIAALVVVHQKFGGPKTTVRYVWDAHLGYFRSMEENREVYDDLTRILIDVLYPEAR
jgi:hypothetical protein